MVNTATAEVDYLVFGKNPYDRFRGRNILRDDVFDAKDPRALKKLRHWSMNQLGAGIIQRFSEPVLYEGEKTKLEKFLALPIISNSLGRWVKVSDRGIYDKMVANAQPIRTERAGKRLDVQDDIMKLMQGDLHRDDMLDMLKDPYRRSYFEGKLPEVLLRRRLSPTIRSIIEAKSKQEREHLAVEMMR